MDTLLYDLYTFFNLLSQLLMDPTNNPTLKSKDHPMTALTTLTGAPATPGYKARNPHRISKPTTKKIPAQTASIAAIPPMTPTAAMVNRFRLSGFSPGPRRLSKTKTSGSKPVAGSEHVQSHSPTLLPITPSKPAILASTMAVNETPQDRPETPAPLVNRLGKGGFTPSYQARRPWSRGPKPIVRKSVIPNAEAASTDTEALNVSSTEQTVHRL